MHDALVDKGTGAGLPDWLVNIPTIALVYGSAVYKEAQRSIADLIIHIIIIPQGNRCK